MSSSTLPTSALTYPPYNALTAIPSIPALTSTLTATLSIPAGVKQGCTLSPTLSNIYQNDIHDIFNNECDPEELDSIFLNSISWADDLVLLSTSKNGFQKERLSDYCEKWQLSVNVLKIKVIVLSAGHS